MRNRSLAEVRTRLEEALEALPGEPATAADIWEQYLMLCIAELDAIHDQFADQILQDYLAALLDLKRLALGLEPLPPP